MDFARNQVTRHHKQQCIMHYFASDLRSWRTNWRSGMEIVWSA